MYCFCLTRGSTLTSQDNDPSSVVYVSKLIMAIWWYLLSKFCALLCCSLFQYSLSILNILVWIWCENSSWLVLYAKSLLRQNVSISNEVLGHIPFLSAFLRDKILTKTKILANKLIPSVFKYLSYLEHWKKKNSSKNFQTISQNFFKILKISNSLSGLFLCQITLLYPYSHLTLIGMSNKSQKNAHL